MSKKTFNDKVDELFDDLELPSDEEVRHETGRIKNSLANRGSGNARYGKPTSDSTKEKIRKKAVGRQYGPDHARKSARPGKLNGMFGVRLTGEHNHMNGKTHTPEARERIAEAALNREEDHQCKFCEKFFTAQAYKQHHGVKCIENPNRPVIKHKIQPRYKCVHCGKEAPIKCFTRLHGDNCRKNKG